MSLMFKHKGAGLIEVLIAILVMAIGILGVFSVQMAGKRNIYEATQRSLATAYARDIIERMRSNPASVASYVSTLGGGSATRAAGTDCTSTTANCTTAALASRDLYEIEQALLGAAESFGDTSSGGLVNPTMCITNNTGNVSVIVAWRGAAETSSPAGDTCGEGLGLYGDDDAQRRSLVMVTYIE